MKTVSIENGYLFLLFCEATGWNLATWNKVYDIISTSPVSGAKHGICKGLIHMGACWWLNIFVSLLSMFYILIILFKKRAYYST